MPQANYQLDRTDVAEAARIHAGIIRPTYFIWIAIVFFLPAISQHNYTQQDWLIRAGIFGPIVLLGVYLRTRTRRRGRWMSGYLANALFPWNKDAGAPQSVSWSDQGFEATTSFGTTRTAWSDFKRWAERDGLYLLYTSRRRYRILPRRAFLGLTEMDDLEGQLTQAGVRRVGPPRQRRLSKSAAIAEAF